MAGSIHLRVLLAASVAALTTLLLALVAAVEPADATFPGTNGRIAFGGPIGIGTINPNGTGLVQLAGGYDPAWSPGGKRIAFSKTRSRGGTEVYVMKANGSNLRRVTKAPGSNWNPTWSPNGRKIAFQSNRNVTGPGDINTDIYVVRSNGRHQRRLTTSTASELMPDWSPDGTRIAFYSTREGTPENGSDIFVMNADGSGVERVTATPGPDHNPDWSPDGTKIAFTNNFIDLYTVNATGTEVKNLTNGQLEFSDDPSWAPDGTKIAFQGERVVGYTPEGDEIIEEGIYLINPDGSERQRIQGTPNDIQGLDWQALP